MILCYFVEFYRFLTPKELDRHLAPFHSTSTPAKSCEILGPSIHVHATSGARLIAACGAADVNLIGDGNDPMCTGHTMSLSSMEIDDSMMKNG